MQTLSNHWISPEILHSKIFLVLLTFVAINTIAYATLSLMKILPILRLPSHWWRRLDPRDRRSQDRSIYGR
jgi:hypothetical protein